MKLADELRETASAVERLDPATQDLCRRVALRLLALAVEAGRLEQSLDRLVADAVADERGRAAAREAGLE